MANHILRGLVGLVLCVGSSSVIGQTLSGRIGIDDSLTRTSSPYTAGWEYSLNGGGWVSFGIKAFSRDSAEQSACVGSSAGDYWYGTNSISSAAGSTIALRQMSGGNVLYQAAAKSACYTGTTTHSWWFSGADFTYYGPSALVVYPWRSGADDVTHYRVKPAGGSWGSWVAVGAGWPAWTTSRCGITPETGYTWGSASGTYYPGVEVEFQHRITGAQAVRSLCFEAGSHRAVSKQEGVAACEVYWIPSLSRGYAWGGFTAAPVMRISRAGTVLASLTAGDAGTTVGVGGTTFTGLSEAVTLGGPGGNFVVEVLDGGGGVRKSWTVNAACNPGKRTTIRVHGSTEEGLLANKYDIRGDVSETDTGQPPPAPTQGPSHEAQTTVTNDGFVEEKFRWQAQGDGLADVWQEFTLGPGESQELNVTSDRAVEIIVERQAGSPGGGSEWQQVALVPSSTSSGLPSEMVTVYQGDWGATGGDFWSDSGNRTTAPPAAAIPPQPTIGAGSDTLSAINNLNADNNARGVEQRAMNEALRKEAQQNAEILAKVMVDLSGKESGMMAELFGKGGGGELGASSFGALVAGGNDVTGARNAINSKLALPTVPAGVAPVISIPFASLQMGISNATLDFTTGTAGTLRALVRAIGTVAVGVGGLFAALAIVRDVA